MSGYSVVDPATSVVPVASQDSMINIAYEASDDPGVLVIVSFEYVSGDVLAAYRVQKGIQRYASSIASKVTRMSP